MPNFKKKNSNNHYNAFNTLPHVRSRNARWRNAFKRAILHSRLDPVFPGVESSRRLRQLRLSDRPRCSTIIVTAPLSGIRTVLCNEHCCTNPTENPKECLFVIISKRDTVPLSPLIVIVSMYLKKFVSKKSRQVTQRLCAVEDET